MLYLNCSDDLKEIEIESWMVSWSIIEWFDGGYSLCSDRALSDFPFPFPVGVLVSNCLRPTFARFIRPVYHIFSWFPHYDLFLTRL